MKNHYVTLGVGVDATEPEIKAAYRRLAFDSHPDRHSGDKEKEARFVEIADLNYPLIYF